MSYILDALKRADAERERGHVPGLRTQPLTVDGSVEKRRTPKPWFFWLGLALAGLALLAVAMTWWTANTGEAPIAATPAPEIAREVTPDLAAESTPEPAPTAAQTAPTLPILSPEPLRVKPTRAPDPASGAAPPGNSAEAKPASNSQNLPSTATVATAPSGSPPSIRNFNELSTEERARLPAVNVSGATYSKNPALRMLIVNGKVSLEGDEVAPGLKLETIEPRAAVLNHQGLRYRIGY